MPNEIKATEGLTKVDVGTLVDYHTDRAKLCARESEVWINNSRSHLAIAKKLAKLFEEMPDDKAD